jgi:hypothetical protein
MNTSGTVHTAQVHVANRQFSIERLACIVLAVLVSLVSIGLYRQEMWATSLWPLPGVRMTFIFLAGIGVAIATPLAWIAWKNEFAALWPAGLELMVGSTAMGAYLLGRAWVGQGWDLALAGFGFAGAGLAGLALYRWTKSLPFRDRRMLPAVFRAGFAIMTAILVLSGIPLAIQAGDVWPWPVSPDTSTLVGLVFLSAAVLFGWITVHPHWPAGELALTAFLACTLVLVVPSVDLLRNRDDPAAIAGYDGTMPFATTSTGSGMNETSLMVYLAVLAFGSLLAIGLHAWGFVQRSSTSPQA